MTWSRWTDWGSIGMSMQHSGTSERSMAFERSIKIPEYFILPPDMHVLAAHARYVGVRQQQLTRFQNAAATSAMHGNGCDSSCCGSHSNRKTTVEDNRQTSTARQRTLERRARDHTRGMFGPSPSPHQSLTPSLRIHGAVDSFLAVNTCQFNLLLLTRSQTSHDDVKSQTRQAAILLPFVFIDPRFPALESRHYAPDLHRCSH